MFVLVQMFYLEGMLINEPVSRRNLEVMGVLPRLAGEIKEREEIIIGGILPHKEARQQDQALLLMML